MLCDLPPMHMNHHGRILRSGGEGGMGDRGWGEGGLGGRGDGGGG